MQKWEYLTLTACYKVADSAWYATWSNDNELIDDQQKITLAQRMKLLGQDGWELVAEHVDPGSRRWEYYFFYVSGKMKSFTVEGKAYGKNNWSEFVDYLGRCQWELVDSYFKPAEGLLGTPEGILIFKRSLEVRRRRLQFKRPLS